MVVVNLHTVLQIQTPHGLIGSIEVVWREGLDIQGLVRQLSLSLDEEHTLIVVNGQIRDVDFLLRDGDQVHLIPAISGGLTT